MVNNSLNAYKKARNLFESPRETEARVLSQGAAKLKKCLDNWDEEGMNRTLYEALRYNQKVWTIFQADLANGNSQQPQEVRENLLSLSIFILRAIQSAMQSPVPEKINPIIDINMSIAQGLGAAPCDDSTKNS
jgi:flagellar biosynthesis activator protein FlaF